MSHPYLVSALLATLALAGCSRSHRSETTTSASASSPSSAAHPPASSDAKAGVTADAAAEDYCEGEAQRWLRLEAKTAPDPPNVFRRASVAAGVSGTLKRTSDEPNVLDFSLLVVNGMNIGELDGKARREGGAFVFRGENPATEKPCVLVFREAPGGFAVAEQSLCPHGAGVEFSGTYVNQVPVTKASFDCKKARSPMERVICADEVLGGLDVAVDAEYRRQRARDDAHFRPQQRLWLEGVEACAATDAGDATDPANRETATRCFLTAYRHRLRELKGGYEAPHGWRDGPELYYRMNALALAREKKPTLDAPGWLAEQTESAVILRLLLGRLTYYELRSFVDGTDPRVEEGYVTTTAAPAGLRGMNEGFLAVGHVGDVYAAILRPANDRPPEGSCIDLWSLGGWPAYTVLPLEHWLSRFPKVPVLRHDLAARKAWP